MRKRIDLAMGQQFGRLTVVKLTTNNKWLCTCSCGETTTTTASHLVSGETKSCGCLRIKHGHSRGGKMSNTYRRWAYMLRRCTNPNHEHYKHYGGRGITVCERWKKSFENFLEDMGEAPPGLQLDRIDNDRGYCKQNCRWVTPKQNSRNRRDNFEITYLGETKCLADWSKQYEVPRTTLRRRIQEYKWPVEKALTTPTQTSKKRKCNGKV